jgi:molecular chaperone GrpE
MTEEHCDKKGQKGDHSDTEDRPVEDTTDEGAEADELEPSADAVADEPDIEQQLADARATLAEMEQKHLYAVADLQNYKRRMRQEVADRMQFANEQVLGDLLPVLDNFRFAVETTSGDTDAEGVIAGVRMILQQLEDLLQSYGVEPVAADPGTDFDPAVHEVVEVLEADPDLRGKVVEEVSRGYTFRDRLLRSAKVKAGALAPGEEEPEDDAGDSTEPCRESEKESADPLQKE